MHPFDTENHPAEIVNIHTGKLSNKDVYVDKCGEIGSEQAKKCHQTWPEMFSDPLSKQVKTISILQKSVLVNDVEIIGTTLVYSRCNVINKCVYGIRKRNLSMSSH